MALLLVAKNAYSLFQASHHQVRFPETAMFWFSNFSSKCRLSLVACARLIRPLCYSSEVRRAYVSAPKTLCTRRAQVTICLGVEGWVRVAGSCTAFPSIFCSVPHLLG